MEFYVVTYPEIKSRIFSSEGDAKNCLGNLGPVHKGMITKYSGQKVSKITGGARGGKNIYTEITL